jgi:hypothetical protein
MATITASPELVSLLGPLTEPTEIRNSQGEVIGTFTPRAVAEEDRLTSLFDLEEAERILQTERDAGRPLQEIWRDLEEKRTPGCGTR